MIFLSKIFWPFEILIQEEFESPDDKIAYRLRECQGKQQKRNSLYSKCGYPISIYRKSWTCSRPVEQDSGIQFYFKTFILLVTELKLVVTISLLKVDKAMFSTTCSIANANNNRKTVPEKCIRWYNFNIIKQCCASFWVFLLHIFWTVKIWVGSVEFQWLIAKSQFSKNLLWYQMWWTDLKQPGCIISVRYALASNRFLNCLTK